MPAAGSKLRLDSAIPMRTVRFSLQEVGHRAQAGSAEDQRVISILAAQFPQLLGITPANVGIDADPLTEEGTSWQ